MNGKEPVLMTNEGTVTSRREEGNDGGDANIRGLGMGVWGLAPGVWHISKTDDEL